MAIKKLEAVLVVEDSSIPLRNAKIGFNILEGGLDFSPENRGLRGTFYGLQSILNIFRKKIYE